LKKRYLTAALLAAAITSFGQQTTPYVKKRIARTDVQALFSFYTQDNDHSAVTGGQGTEDLQVYTSQVSIDVNKDSINTFHLDGGVDVISSASTDRIDFEMSSASKVDARSHARIGYNRLLPTQHMNVGATASFSIESDYLSIGGGLSWNYTNPSQQREVSLAVQAYFDDLRWGRLENGHPQKLVYPEELRYKNWFDEYRRNSINIEAGFLQTINRRMTLGIYPAITYQQGLLSTPFHRIYFTDGSKGIETLPSGRLKIPVGLQVNTFLGNSWVLRTSYRYFYDDFGIVAHALNVESAVKISRVFTVTPFVRLYTQQGADYFKAYNKHDVSETYYTSDYDLSSFESIKPGVGIRYAPFTRGKTITFNDIEMRYALYHRTDGMQAHMITVFFNYTVERAKTRPLSER
jgi:hypothetical protein